MSAVGAANEGSQPVDRRPLLGRLVASGARFAPWQVAAVVLLVYIAVLVPVLTADRHGLVSTLSVGSKFVAKSEASPRISRVHPTELGGYDGQFAYFIALDPLKARYYIDNPGYRYGRILYSVAGWLGAAGQPGAMPYSFLGVNLAAVAGAVWLLGAFLRRHGRAAWWAAVYGFFPGLYLCVRRDLTEPLAFFLVACALFLLDRYPRRPLLAAPFFALAALDREVVLIFILLAGIAVALRGRTGRRLTSRSVWSASLLVALSVAPFFAYREVVDYWLGSAYFENPVPLVPLGGLADYPLNFQHRVILFLVVVPGVAWLVFSCWVAARRGLDLALALVMANAALFVLWLPSGSYVDFIAASRASTGLVLSAVLAVPVALSLEGTGRRAAWGCYFLLTPLWAVDAILLASVL